jgi:undecaprenyl diphosphate synthase
MASLKDKINKEALPQHVAIIMDGNGRWAQKNGKPRIFGHANAISSVRAATEAAAELGIKYLTLYVFSTENWNRPEDEVSALMKLLVSTIESEIVNLNKNNVRLKTIGNTDRLIKQVNNKLQEGIELTSKNTGLTLVLALSYSARWEITNAVKQIALNVTTQGIDPNTIDETTVASFLTTKEIPDPELLIRTSGEYRISNFLLWQIAYTELYFTPVLWPDFNKEDFYGAIIDFQQRERRFGKTSEQVAK